MEKLKLHRAIAAAAAAAITLGMLSAITSIAAKDQARLAQARSVQVVAAANAAGTPKR